jgi:hypothetical protein
VSKAQVQSRAEAGTSIGAEATTEVSKVSIVVVGVFAAIVGLWSLACIIGGIVSSGSVGELLSGWFKAVTGM